MPKFVIRALALSAIAMLLVGGLLVRFTLGAAFGDALLVGLSTFAVVGMCAVFTARMIAGGLAWAVAVGLVGGVPTFAVACALLGAMAANQAIDNHYVRKGR